MEQPPVSGESAEVDAALGRAWREHHSYVLDVAFRVLGSVSEAEDMVQEAFARLVDADLETIEDVRGWLVVVVSRLCFDQLRSARWQRQRPFDPQAERTPSAEVDPADRVTLDDEVRIALHVVMARLSPAERTAFVLHDVFGYSFNEVGSVVGRSPAASRQLAARARHHLHGGDAPARFTIESAEQRRVTDEFIAAASTGDVDALLAVLDPDVAGQADLGGSIGLLPPVVGPDAVAARALLFFGPTTGTTLLSLPIGGHPTILALREHRVYATLELTVEHGRVTHLHGVVAPEKLADLDRILDA